MHGGGGGGAVGRLLYVNQSTKHKEIIDTTWIYSITHIKSLVMFFGLQLYYAGVYLSTKKVHYTAGAYPTAHLFTCE